MSPPKSDDAAMTWCHRCGSDPAFGPKPLAYSAHELNLRADAASRYRAQLTRGWRICEHCLADIEQLGWTVAEWIHARLNFETVQVHNALCRGPR